MATSIKMVEASSEKNFISSTGLWKRLKSAGTILT